MNGGYWEAPKACSNQQEQVRIVEPGICPYCVSDVPQERLDAGFFHCINCSSAWVADRRSNMVLVLNHKSAYHPMFIDNAHISRNARR